MFYGRGVFAAVWLCFKSLLSKTVKKIKKCCRRAFCRTIVKKCWRRGCRDVLEKSVVEKPWRDCWRRVLQRTVGEECCRDQLEKSVVEKS